MKKLFKNWVRSITGWAWQHEKDVCDSVAKIKEIHMTPGHAEITIEQDPILAQYVARSFATLVAQAPNYTEMQFQVPSPKDWEYITVHIIKHNGKTPHQLRMEVEMERNKLSDLYAEAIAELQNADTILRSAEDSILSGIFIRNFREQIRPVLLKAGSKAEPDQRPLTGE